MAHIYIRGFYTGQKLLKKNLTGKTVYQWSPNFLSAGTRNQLMKFRGTPATALFGGFYFSRQRSLKLMRRSSNNADLEKKKEKGHYL